MIRVPSLLMLAAWAGLGAGCGGSAPGTASAPSFSGEPSQTITTATGNLTVEVRWSPDTPVKGEDAAELSIKDAQGEVVDGLTVDVEPWMPAHGHGTSVRPVETAAGPGVVVAAPLYLYMSGQWQLRMTISGTQDDTAIATVEIP